MRFLTSVLVLFYLAVPLAVHAQDPNHDDQDKDDRLGDFEKAATDDSQKKDDTDGKKDDRSGKKHRHGGKHDDTDDEDAEDYGWFADLMIGMGKVTFFTVVGGGGISWVRVHGSSDPEWTSMAPPRITGEPGIPFFRLDAFYQDVESDIQAADVSGEIGYGPFAFQYRHTHYTQDRPDNDLDLSQILGLYRMSFTEYVEVDLGFGSMTLDGENRHSGFEFSVPVTIQPSPYLGGRFRPAWGYMTPNTVKDFTLVLTGSLRFASLQAGYRWVSAGGVSLNGPVVGIAFHF
jgi:hypothetical protein